MEELVVNFGENTGSLTSVIFHVFQVKNESYHRPKCGIFDTCFWASFDIFIIFILPQ